MSESFDLYQELILDHNARPQNFGTLPGATHHARGFNPLCGDRLELFLKVDAAGKVADIRFQGEGCAISKSSSSLMTAAIKGKTRAEAKVLFEKFHRLLMAEPSFAADWDELGKLAVFSNVRKYPARVKCASLAWHTLKAALEQESQPVSTEE